MSLTVITPPVATARAAHRSSSGVQTASPGQTFACQYVNSPNLDAVVVYGRFEGNEPDELVPSGRWLPGDWFVRSLSLSSGAASSVGRFKLYRECGKPPRHRTVELSWFDTDLTDWGQAMLGLARALAPADQSRMLPAPELIMGANVQVRAAGETAVLPISGLVLTKTCCAYQFAPGLRFGELRAAPAALVRGWSEGADQCRLIFYPGSQTGLDGSFRFV